MEIRTCEQYVLAELKRREEEIERLKEQIRELEEMNFNQSLTIGELTTKARELSEVFEKLLGFVERDDESYGTFYSMTVSATRRSDDFKFIEELKKEREPNSEENDSQNNVSEL